MKEKKMNSKYAVYLKDLMIKKQKDPEFEVGHLAM